MEAEQVTLPAPVPEVVAFVAESQFTSNGEVVLLPVQLMTSQVKKEEVDELSLQVTASVPLEDGIAQYAQAVPFVECQVIELPMTFQVLVRVSVGVAQDTLDD